MAEVDEISISPEDIALTHSAPTVSLDRRVGEGEVDPWPQAPEIGWGDNFYIFSSALGWYATDPSYLEEESFSSWSC